MSKIKWIKPSERLPQENQEVLVNCRGEVSLAIYKNKKFKLRDGKCFPGREADLTWTELR